jgi:hypothetical protein
LAEDLLHFFYVLCDAATKTVSLAVLTKFFGNLDKDLFAILLSHGTTRTDVQTATVERKRALLLQGIAFYKRLQKVCGASAVLPPWPFPAAPAVDAAAVPTASAASLAPRLIEYSAEGKPLCAQDVLKTSSEDFSWATFMDTACVSDALLEDQGRAAVISALHRLFFLYFLTWVVGVLYGFGFV